MTFLAGAGIGPLLDQLSQLMAKAGSGKNPNAPSAELPHRAGLRMEASGAPGTMTIAPQMLQQLIAQQQQPNQVQQMLQMLAARGGVMPGGAPGGMPGGMPAPMPAA